MYRNKSPQDSGFRAPQFSLGRKPEAPPGAEVTLQVEDVFETRPGSREAPFPAPTVVVRRKRRIDVPRAPDATTEVDAASPDAERQSRVFTIKHQGEQATVVGPPARSTTPAATQLAGRSTDPNGSHSDDDVVAPAGDKTLRRRRRVPDHARPSEAVITRPSVAQQLEAVEAAAAAQDQAPSGSPFKFDLFINTRWACVDKALNALKKSLPAKKPSRARSSKL